MRRVTTVATVATFLGIHISIYRIIEKSGTRAD